MASTNGNRAVTFQATKDMRVESLDFPKLEMPNGEKAPHGVILRIVATNICGSDLHIYRGSFPVPQGMVMGHEMTGEVIELGPDVEFLSEGDLVSVPFNVACGRCRNCRARRTDVCETTNPKVACGAYGFNLGDWTGGQAEYLFVPYADFQLLRFPDRDQALAKIRDLALLSDILPTAFHGLMEAGAKPGSTVYLAGAGPVGRCGAAAARLLGASCIIVGDHDKDRLELVKRNGCETIDLSQDAALTDQIEAILGEPMVDCAVDYVGTEAHGIGREVEDMDPAYAINQVIDATRAGGATGVIGVYGPDPLAKSKPEQEGTYPIDFGKAWIKSPRIAAGQAPIMHYNRELMMAILWDRMPYLSDMLNTTVISLDDAPEAYATFDRGVAEKFIINPHGLIPT
ncbi:alcohol dehydrogenase catalytic domain-containing protein [Streptomyces griseoluteus]|uniref:alcohol dehydrogenase catalytic domain-containing protein n=1 Tax=Streptomyces griseoluteus TaxID=29306 RepID=UPI0036EB8220